MCGDMGKAVLRALTGALLCGLVSDAAYLQTPWPNGIKQTGRGNPWPAATHDHVIVMDDNTPTIEWILGRLDKPSIHNVNRWPPKQPLDTWKPIQDYTNSLKTDPFDLWKPKDYKPWDKWKEDFDYRPRWRPFEYKYIPKDGWRPNLSYRPLNNWNEHTWKEHNWNEHNWKENNWKEQENYQTFEFKPHTKWHKKLKRVAPKLPLAKPFRYYREPQTQKYWWNRYHEPDYPHYEQAVIRKPLREHEKPQDLRNVPGVPGVDYPIYHAVPETGFSCHHVPFHPGMYANVETGCQRYHEPDYPHYEQAVIRKPLREHEKPQDLRNVPGVPGVDYPIYHAVPETGFSCHHVPFHPGMYANVETGCQAYHVCHDGREGHQGASFLCTNGTLFDQEKFACDWWYNVDCSQALEHYKLNADPLKNPYTPKPKPEEHLEQQRIYYKL